MAVSEEEKYWMVNHSKTVLREILRWLLLRVFDKGTMIEHVLPILSAAREFGVRSLMREVSRELLNQLSTDNVFNFIAHADLCDLTEVKDILFNFVLDKEVNVDFTSTFHWPDLSDARRLRLSSDWINHMTFQYKNKNIPNQ